MKNTDAGSFWKKYTLVGSTKNYKAVISSPRACRFCKKPAPEVTFKKDAHVIPELLGENNITAADECDSCNQHFSAYESHLSKYYLPNLALMGVKGKRRVPIFQSRSANGGDKRTAVEVKGGERKVSLASLDDYTVDYQNKTATLVFRQPPHTPFLVYKALCKIGLSLMPYENLPAFEEVFKWLLDDSPYVSTFVFSNPNVLVHKMFANPWAELYRAERILYRQSFRPEYTLIIGFANIVLQVWLPLSNSKANAKSYDKKPLVELYPGFMFDDLTRLQKVIIKAEDLGNKKNITADQHLHFSFQDGEFNIRSK